MRRLTELRVLLSGQSGQAQILGLFPVDYGNELCSVLSQKELSKVHCRAASAVEKVYAFKIGSGGSSKVYYGTLTK